MRSRRQGKLSRKERMKKRFLVVRLRFALSSSSIFPRSLLYFFSLISPFPPSLSSSFPFSASLFSSSSIHPPPNHPPFLHHYLFSTSLPFKWFFPPFVASSISRCFFFFGVEAIHSSICQANISFVLSRK